MVLVFAFAGGFDLSAVHADDAIDFNAQVKPILENNCVRCHNPEKAKSKLRLDNRADAFKGGADGIDIVPGDPAKSPLYTSTQLPADDDKKMPPKDESLTKAQTETLRLWILQGAKWPEGVTLIARKIVVAETNDEVATISEIRKKIIAQGNAASPAEMKSYTETIPGTRVTFDMVPIPAGTFVMGSPESEAKRKADEGPQRKISVSPFWMERCEVTWNEFELFMYPEMKKGNTPEIADAVTHPTKPYVEMSFGMGKDGFPAISMTQHAANTYCKWLSAKTGHFYRLPTEAEWEYACRAGTTTAYSFGDDVSKLGDYAWFAGNSDGKYQKVGQKKPNPWGLFDMHGNVAEWTLDQYSAQGYGAAAAGVIADPWVKATTPYPQAVRGGSWQDDPELLRSAARRGSDPSWKMQDPQLPKSIWYHTDAQFLGFRIVRPLTVPTAEELKNFWDSGVEHD
ncbi:MAG TPA: SUMF1/EgtB/PvdO family nonheme iron enzyme [Verrucomicrobiae bacterium]|jgi:formylglycine-generating enzyme required for sulfatase activity|nr:SUMF1/EgtB/PvdO family nonheme iron enzyme [Verrucomicrobiae bacterium]